MTFDDVVPTFAKVIADVCGVDVLASGCVLRDSQGKVCLVTEQPLSDDTQKLLNSAASEAIQQYFDPGFGASISAADFGEPDIFDSDHLVTVRVDGVGAVVRLLDRPIVGADWSMAPARGWAPPEPARFVFWSLKGGVGRSTALSVAAVSLAREGKHVLVVDLDLEAPGVGSMLLNPDELPKFGSMDWFVENGLAELDEKFYLDLWAPASIDCGRGVLHVVPAVGRIGREFPENIVAKLGRAYVDDPRKDGTLASFGAQVQDLLRRLEHTEPYDIVFIDCRAGLNESTPASLLGLGADVLCFGINQAQTFDGFKYLLAHTRQMNLVRDDDDWRTRLKMVHAKAVSGKSTFNDNAYALFSEYVYENQGPTDETLNFDIDDPDAPHVPWLVFDDSRYREFDPLADAAQCSDELVRATFGQLVDGIRDRATVE